MLLLDGTLEAEAGISHGYLGGSSLLPAGKLGLAAAAGAAGGAAGGEVTLLSGAAVGSTLFGPVSSWFCAFSALRFLKASSCTSRATVNNLVTYDQVGAVHRWTRFPTFFLPTSANSARVALPPAMLQSQSHIQVQSKLTKAVRSWWVPRRSIGSRS